MTLKKQVLLLLEENKLLRERISELEELLRKAMIHINSSNSSKPPSSDISKPKRNQSLRRKSEKKSGGQPGHKGTTLLMSNKPDIVEELNPNYCNDCGKDLEDIEPEFISKRQVIDIPPITTITTEYRKNAKKCPHCGNIQHASYPKQVSNHVQYGSNVEAAIAYLSIYQYVPYKRMKECLLHFFGLNISEGSIDNIIKRMAIKAFPLYNRIKETIPLSNQAGSDESSAKINGKNWWVWVWQTYLSTFISISQNRGSETIDRLFPAGFENTILNSDRWAAQLKTKAKGHQLCMAHLLRDLNYLLELEKNDWSEKVKQIFKEAIKHKSELPESKPDNTIAMQLERKLDLLLKANIPKKCNKKTLTFQKSLIKHRNSIFTFLYHSEVPADNNASERAIRNIKVKQKISGQFKSGQNCFSILRSVIDTCLKRNVDILFALNSIARLNPAE